MPGPIAVRDHVAECRLCPFVSEEQIDAAAAEAVATAHVESMHPEVEEP